MLVKSLEAFDVYAHVKAEIERDSIREFLGRIAKEKSVVLFGCGYVGACAYCLLRVNGADNIVAFSDNDKRKWGTEKKCWKDFQNIDKYEVLVYNCAIKSNH